MHRLSKSKYVAGLQGPKLLWWQVHEPEAEELVPEIEQIFDAQLSRQVGATENFEKVLDKGGELALARSLFVRALKGQRVAKRCSGEI